ncbi:MAG: 1-deoxy-D-xylulose-5-phosphate synthase [Parasporobacterium sp.]|nr:1-deoxy-D-xylulose-5-phosphate synthase [Parasporobacterium sp.]
MEFPLLESIKSPEDVKGLSKEQLATLAKEIRKFLVLKVGKSGGHLASNLGAVELTLALLQCTNLPEDKIIWDVGHQSYVYKMLTGRADQFDHLREYGGLSGFPKRRESEYDAFNTGHSSTSLSAGLGLAMASQLEGNDRTVIAVIGDGSLTGGLALEALNYASNLKRNFIIILNDNNMSIAKNVGGLSSYLSGMRAGELYNDMKTGVAGKLSKVPVIGEKLIRQIKKTKSSLKQLIIPGMFFENIGITYLGPFDGHDTESLVKIINEAKNMDHPVVIHVKTKKGKGYKPAEKDPEKFHGIGPFDPATGEVLRKSPKMSYTQHFSQALIQVGETDPKVVAITAAMPDGTGLSQFRDRFPDRFFDVGIAEEHAVTFAAGLAAAGYKPFVAIYSSFLQRAFDEVMHDVCIQNLPVVFCIDRAGLVGQDGETHQGIFDISYLNLIPNMNIIAPKNSIELQDAIRFAADFNAPLAIRYPRGSADDVATEFREPFVFGKSEGIFLEKDIAIISVGTMINTAILVRHRLKEKGLNVTLINARFVKPFDEKLIDDLLVSHKYIITMEENVISGGYGMEVLRHINNVSADVRVIPIAIPNLYVEQGEVSIQKRECRIDVDSICERLEKELL